jgi:small-conductance mechanosensitive channel
VLFIFYIVACIGNAIVTIVTFLLYVKARLADRTEARHSTETGHVAHLAELDKKEKKYQSLHFITLSLFVLFGVLILIHLSNRLNGGVQR